MNRPRSQIFSIMAALIFTVKHDDAKENAACKRRICKRSHHPKIDRIVNNDARLILRKKLNGAMI